MESNDSYYNNNSNDYFSSYNEDMLSMTVPLSSPNKLGLNSAKQEASYFELNDNININDEIEIMNEKRKINIFNIGEKEDKKPKNQKKKII